MFSLPIDQFLMFLIGAIELYSKQYNVNRLLWRRGLYYFSYHHPPRYGVYGQFGARGWGNLRLFGHGNYFEYPSSK